MTALPPPGSEEQLKNLASRVFAQQLDRYEAAVGDLARRRPRPDAPEDALRARRKTHHCLVDGVAGVDITTVLFDTEREPRPRRRGRRGLGGATGADRRCELLGEALVERLTKPAEIVRRRERAAALAAPDRRRGASGRCGRSASFARSGCGARALPLNVEIGPHRRFDFGARRPRRASSRSRIASAAPSTTSSWRPSPAALRRFLERTRRAGQRASSCGRWSRSACAPPRSTARLGNRVVGDDGAAADLVRADPVERLQPGVRVDGRPEGLRPGGRRAGADRADRLRAADRAAQAARLQSRQRFFNLVVTNVPGPQMPALRPRAGRLLDVFPLVPLAKRQAVCIAVMSYNGKMNFGLLGDYDAMADLNLLARGIAPRSASCAWPPALPPSAPERTERARRETRALERQLQLSGGGRSRSVPDSARPDQHDRRRHRRQCREGRRVDRAGARTGAPTLASSRS